jgi:hypothetical protein
MVLKNCTFSLVLMILITINHKGFSQSTDITIAQSTDSLEKNIDKIVKHGVVLKFNNAGSSYLKFGMGVQLWYRNMEMNPNTIDKRTEKPIDYYSDFALRRMRMSMMLNYEGQHFIYSQFGLTSESSYNGLHSGMFFHDLWYKARVAEKTYLGAGLHMWNGLSRLSNVTYATQLTLDNPGINFPNVNVADDFVRQYGVFLQGQISNFEYSFSVNQPLLPISSTKILNDSEIIENGNLNTAYNRYHSNFNYKGYVYYSLFEKESVAKTPFKRMTYYGEKGMFLNIGTGFQYVAEASGALMINLVDDTDVTVKQYSQLSYAVDLWYEQPLMDESVLNIYTAYYKYEYGPNYLKSGSVMGGFAASNPNEDSPAQGSGINQFSIGTGDALYLSMSYVIPKNIFRSNKKIMPFYAVTYKNFEGLNEASVQHDFGLHYLILGNNVKLSAQYSTRPIYDSNSLKVIENKGLFTLQLHAKF